MRKLTKTWMCPTCSVEFMAGAAAEKGRHGRRCPSGHFHTYYELYNFAGGIPIGNRHAAVTEPAGGKVVGPTKEPPTKSERDYYLALLWVGAVDSLMAQLPERSIARAMVEGALEQAYRVSKRIVDPAEIAAEERRSA
jgi:hypothetical protein